MALELMLKLNNDREKPSSETHDSPIEVLAWSWGMSRYVGHPRDENEEFAPLSMQDLSLTKYIDPSSIVLMHACNKAHVYPTATLTIKKPENPAIDYLEITFKNAQVTSMSTGGSQGEDRLTENVCLSFESADVTYQKQKEDIVDATSSQTFCWSSTREQ